MGLALTVPTPDAVLEFGAFASRLKRLGPYNIMIVYAQRPRGWLMQGMGFGRSDGSLRRSSYSHIAAK